MRVPRSKSRVVFLLFACFAAAQEPSVFHSGTRLVEVDVVVRDKYGPVKGLTKDDFALFDCKWSERNQYNSFAPCKVKRQPLEVFREIDSAISQGSAPLVTPRPGAVSNRVDSDGQPLASPTVVLIDLLNTPFELKGYARDRIIHFMQKIGEGNSGKNRIALYSLGRSLHVLQDFTDDPKKLIKAVANVDFAEIGADPYGDTRLDLTEDAVKTIIRHTAGVPGRKNLVWIAQDFPFDPLYRPPVVRNLLGQANFAVYPVKVRLLVIPNITGPTFHASRAMRDLIVAEGMRKLGESLGGTAFNDAEDALDAVRTAEDDAKNYYVLGFYPAEKDLDGKTHQLTLDVSKRVAAKHDLVLTYRQEYLASKPGSAIPDDRPSVEAIFSSPLNVTAIGLAANVVANQLQVSVNLGDLQLRQENGRSVGSFQVVVRFERKVDGILKATDPVTQTVPISFAAGQVQDYGLVTQPIPPGMQPSTAHIVVQDTANAAAGSLRVPIP